MATLSKPKVNDTPKAAVYCPMCTHTVDAEVLTDKKAAWVKPGQKCPRCNSALDAGYVISLTRAA